MNMLREDLQKALKESMINKDTTTVSAVRLIIAGLKEKDVDARGRGQKEATDAELFSMMQNMIKQRKDSIKMYLEGHRQDLADKEQSEITVIERFLPKQMSASEAEAAIKAIISSTGASSMKDMGKVMSALREQYGDKVRILYEPGVAYSRDKRTDGIARAVTAARNADVVIAFVGEEAILSGEAHSLADLNLKGAQPELLSALAATGRPLVTVFMAGRPLTIARQVEESDAVLYAFHPGTMGGPALANILFGKVVPCGKTPVTFPRMTGQCPIYYAHHHTGRAPSGKETLIDEIELEAGQSSLGCSSYYLDAGFGPLFPFGYGLSYTTFAYDDLKLSATELNPNEKLTASVKLTNTGKRAGTEVVQLYVRDKVGSVTRPVKELKGFQRITLQPGETQTVTFELPIRDLAFWNIDMKKVVEPGDFTLWIGTNSDEGLSADFKVKK